MYVKIDDPAKEQINLLLAYKNLASVLKVST
jgi:hypothetical protein